MKENKQKNLHYREKTNRDVFERLLITADVQFATRQFQNYKKVFKLTEAMSAFIVGSFYDF